MKIMVTGGNGFIGHTLVRHLLNEGNEVKVIDIKPIKFNHPKLEFVKKSVLEDLRWEMRDCDMIYHLAAELGVVNSDKKPLNTLAVNIDGTVNVFKCALGTTVKKIVYTSSSEVYGEAREIPLKEDSPKSPVSIYGVSKLTAEMYAKGYVQEYGMDINPVRLFNVYGPGQGFEWVMPIFIQKVLNNEQPVVFGDGTQVRCFTYIADVVSGIETVRKKGAKGEAYNIANTDQITMKELAELIIKISGKNLKPNVVGFGKDTRTKEREIMTRIPSIEKLKSLGWEPSVSAQEGIQKAYNWYKDNLGKEELFYE
ncbi:GDP-mannose 4,6-dehydratase [Candidatus Woesearchaeota archaeon]|nr:GDP-mannose 4,6-dehydratase [Candidatus Woesearchaeota archaeon]